MRLPRFLTLPKSRNSVDDILGRTVGSMFTQLGKQAIAQAVADAMKSGGFTLTQKRDKVISNVLRALPVPAELQPLLRAEIENAFDRNITATLAVATERITAAIYKFLKV